MLTTNERLRYLEDNRWTCRRLAHEIGCSPSTVWRALNFDQGSRHLKQQIASKLGLEPATLFGAGV